MRVVALPKHDVPIVAIDIWMRAGTRRQHPDQPGVAHYLEHMLFKGTPTRPDEDKIDGAVEDLGGTLNASTSFDWAHFYTIVPSNNFEQALDVLADALQHPSLAQEALDTEKPVIASEIARQEDDPEQALSNVAHHLVFGDTPYGKTIMGSTADVQSITRSEVAAFYKAFYGPNNATLVVSGDVTPDQVHAAAQKLFGNWAPVPLPLEDHESTFTAAARRKIMYRNGSQTYMMMAFAAPGVKDQPDTWIMDVLLTLLGQSPNSRLDVTLRRQQHLVNSITADYLTQRSPGVMTITATLPTGELEPVEKAIVEQIQNIQEHGVSVADVDAAKQGLLQSYLFETETDSGKADSLGFYDAINSYTYDTQYVDHFESVTADDVQRIAKKYLDLSKYTLVAFVPPSGAANASAAPTPRTFVALSEHP
jgi:predicted Zn-dependent peptidase